MLVVEVLRAILENKKQKTEKMRTVRFIVPLSSCELLALNFSPRSSIATDLLSAFTRFLLQLKCIRS